MIFIAKVLVVIFSLCGFFLANYIRGTKKKALAPVCPLNGSCETVIYSRYSTLFGISIEKIGIFYYALVAIFYAISAVGIFDPAPLFSNLILGLTAAAFVFSIYLTVIQAVFLRHWCTWCLLSAGICTILFSLVVFILELSLSELISSVYSLF